MGTEGETQGVGASTGIVSFMAARATSQRGEKTSFYKKYKAHDKIMHVELGNWRMLAVFGAEHVAMSEAGVASL